MSLRYLSHVNGTVPLITADSVATQKTRPVNVVGPILSLSAHEPDSPASPSSTADSAESEEESAAVAELRAELEQQKKISRGLQTELENQIKVRANISPRFSMYQPAIVEDPNKITISFI